MREVFGPYNDSNVKCQVMIENLSSSTLKGEKILKSSVNHPGY